MTEPDQKLDPISTAQSEARSMRTRFPARLRSRTKEEPPGGG